MDIEEVSEEKQEEVLEILASAGTSNERVLKVFYADEKIIRNEMSAVWTVVDCAMVLDHFSRSHRSLRSF